MSSAVNKALEHVLRAVLEKTAEFHRIQDDYDFKEFGGSTCLPEEPCFYCQLQTATLAAVADVWERTPEEVEAERQARITSNNGYDPHDEEPHNNC